MRPTALAAALTLLAAPPAVAEPYVVDESHASITFSVDHLGFSAVRGQFREFDVQVDFDPKAVETTRVRFVIDPASVDTNWQKRDDHLLSGDFFDVASYPEIVFESTRVQPTGSDTADVTGNLTIRGVTREVTFEAELNRLGTSPLTGKPTAGFTARGVVDRTEFGMGWGAPDIGAEVPIEVQLEMSPAG